MTYSSILSRKQFVFVAFTAFVFLFVAQSTAFAQRKLQPGDEFPAGGDGLTFRIIECRAQANSRLEECDYFLINANYPTTNAPTKGDIRTGSVFDIRRRIQTYEFERKNNPRSQPKNQTPVEVNIPPSEIPSETVEMTVTAQQLYKEYDNNDTAAKRKYVDKTVRVTGAVVNTISSESFNATITKTFLRGTIECNVEDLEQLPTLNKGETVTIVGIPRGSLTSTGVIFTPCRVERKVAAQAAKPAAAKPPVKTAGTADGKVVGMWYYTAIIDADGTEQKLSNRQSYLMLKQNGSYEHWFGNFGQNGTFLGSGSRLTLNAEDGDKQSYTMTIAGTTMTLKNASGGYKLERK